MEMIAGRWRAGAIPAHFADDALASVERGLAKEREAIARAEATPGERSELEGSLAAVERDARRVRALLAPDPRRSARADP